MNNFFSDKSTERKILTEEMSKLVARANMLLSEQKQLEQARDELLATKSSLEFERRSISDQIKRIKTLVKRLR